MSVLSTDRKLLTLSLVLRTLPREQQSLLMAHFSPEVVKRLAQIEQATGGADVEKLDWTPFYESWPELQKIISDCKEEIKAQKIQSFADEQRAKLREYILLKLGKQKKGPPIFLSQEIIKVIDQQISNLRKT